MNIVTIFAQELIDELQKIGDGQHKDVARMMKEEYTYYGIFLICIWM